MPALPCMLEIKRYILKMLICILHACVQRRFWYNPTMQLLILLKILFHSLDSNRFAFFFCKNLQAFDFELESLNISSFTHFLKYMKTSLEISNNELMKKLLVCFRSSSDKENICKAIKIQLAMHILNCKHHFLTLQQALL